VILLHAAVDLLRQLGADAGIGQGDANFDLLRCAALAASALSTG
jgi:hypothetical protein